jgi:hypothetical protein
MTPSVPAKVKRSPLRPTLRAKDVTLLLSLAAGSGFGLAGLSAAGPAATVPQPAEPSPAAAAIGKLLETETTPGKTRLETIKPLYQQALTVAPRDPRLEYAYSLLLLRIFEPAEARVHLQRALEIDRAFPPANQAVIRELVKARNFREAGERLGLFVEMLDSSRLDSQAAAEWIGRIVSAVMTTLGTPDAQSQFAYHDRMFRASLSPVLLASYERGFAGVERELDTLTWAIEQARASAADKRDVAKAQVDSDLQRDQVEIKQKQQDAQKSRQKWDEWINDQTTKADDLLREHEKRFQDLDRAITSQQQSITALRIGLDRLQRGFVDIVLQNQQQIRPQRPAARRTQPVTPVTGLNSGSIELQLAVEEQRLAGLFDQQAVVSRQASQTLAARRNAVAQYEQATGVALKEAANLDRWEKRNKTIAENMKKAAEKKPVQVATLEARIRTLNTWDPSDFETEKRRLLADLGVAPKEKQPPPASQK